MTSNGREVKIKKQMNMSTARIKAQTSLNHSNCTAPIKSDIQIKSAQARVIGRVALEVLHNQLTHTGFEENMTDIKNQNFDRFFQFYCELLCSLLQYALAHSIYNLQLTLIASTQWLWLISGFVEVTINFFSYFEIKAKLDSFSEAKQNSEFKDCVSVI